MSEPLPPPAPVDLPPLSDLQVRAVIRNDIRNNNSENLKKELKYFLTSFPATPKITSPEPGDTVFLFSDLFVWMKTNRGDLDYEVTILDLTNPGNIIDPVVVPAPGDAIPAYFMAQFDAFKFVSGSQYRIRVAATSGPPANEPDTIYITIF